MINIKIYCSSEDKQLTYKEFLENYFNESLIIETLMESEAELVGSNNKEYIVFYVENSIYEIMLIIKEKYPELLFIDKCNI